MSKYAKLIFGILILGLIIVAIALPKPKSAIQPVKRQSKNLSTNNYQLTTIFLAGDIMLSRNVGIKIQQAQDPTLPFQKVADQTKNADIAFANLESSFSDQGQHNTQGLIFNADPKNISGLSFAGFDILSTANNHALDNGPSGLQYNYDWLIQNNIQPIGTTADCHKGVMIEKNNLKFGFLAYSYAAYNDGGRKSDPLVCNADNLDQISADIKNLKPQVDYVIVSTHMGVEYTRTPTPAQIKFSHNAIDSGADLVIGNHPHWVQTIEQYKGKWIFYSLGNFIFDQMWSVDTRQGLTATLTFSAKGGSLPARQAGASGGKNIQLNKIELKPVMIDDYCCPRWANDNETKNILGKINLTSPLLLQHN